MDITSRLQPWQIDPEENLAQIKGRCLEIDKMLEFHRDEIHELSRHEIDQLKAERAELADTLVHPDKTIREPQ
jgi:hypothetical protein